MTRHVDAILQRKAEWLQNLPARTGLKICNHALIRRRLGARHEAALAEHRRHVPRLGKNDQDIVDAIKRDGIAITSLDALALAGSDDLLAVSLALADEFAASAREFNAAGKVFIIVPPDRLLANAQIIEWGLQDRLLDIAEAYIGLPSAYDGVVINYTVADGREVSTRRWHRDWEDRQVLKIAVYLHDVDEQGGPFEVLRRDDTPQSDSSGYSYELADDAALARQFGAHYRSDVVSCTGLRGTVVFADTARLFHRGKPTVARDRAALFYSYFSRTPRHPFFCERTGLNRQDLQRLAATLPQRQQDAVGWRRRLPLPLRMIPPASL